MSPGRTCDTAKPLKPEGVGSIPPGDGRRLEREGGPAARVALRLDPPLLELEVAITMVVGGYSRKLELAAMAPEVGGRSPANLRGIVRLDHDFS